MGEKGQKDRDKSQKQKEVKQQQQTKGKQVKQQQQVTDLDLQAKCGKDANAWFHANWQRDKDTASLDYSNHYNKAVNKCFILVQFNSWLGVKNTFLAKDVIAYDVFENVEKAHINEVQNVNGKDDFVSLNCTIDHSKKDVKTFQDCFNQIHSAYMEK